MSASGAGATIKRRLLGLGLIVVILGFLTLTIAQFNKVFTPVVMVSLHTDHAGSQLQKHSDVKLDGLIVGEVRDLTATTQGADLKLAIDPAQAKLIPDDVTARLLPKTLFGEKYVALQMPATGGDHRQALAAGDHISQDRSKAAIETEQALNDLMPVLQAVQPQKLSATLTAVSQALQGRGNQLGDTLKQLGQYVGELNPHLPALEHDLSALADVSQTYSDAAPDLVHALNDLTTTSRTLYDQRANLTNLFASVTNTSQNLQNFLQVNKDNLIGVTSSSLPTLRLLAKYAPEYPCFLKGMADAVPKLDKAFGKGTGKPGLHATIEVTVNRGSYKPNQDLPRWNDHRGPRCYDLKNAPNPFPQYPPDGPIKDGTTVTPPARSRSDGILPAGSSTSPQSASSASQASNLPNSQAERNFIAELAAPEVGASSPAAVPGWSSLLLGPLFRGSEVNLK
ncbi:MAG: MCE family protein [Sciscionella sp.]